MSNATSSTSGPPARATAEALRREVLAAYQAEFEHLLGTFRDLDGKAQGTTAIAGAFLAVGLGSLGEASAPDRLFPMLLLLLVATLGLVLFFAVWTLVVREVPHRPSGDDLHRLVTDLLRHAPDLPPEELATFASDRLAPWRECVAAFRHVIERKSAHLRTAQRGLLAAAVEAVALILARMFQI